ncbi:hypothetical protein L6R50_21730 [Myxococcota bacterium]|nr:hypothetical protein [Myxococcota bacterium]
MTSSRPEPESPRPALPDAVAEVFARVAAIDPLLVEAADEVDLGLVRRSMLLTPRDRMRATYRSTSALTGYRRVRPTDG